MLCGLEGEKSRAPAKMVVAGMWVVAAEREKKSRIRGVLRR